MEDIIFQNEYICVKKEPSSVPWIKIFTTTPYKELTDCPKELRDKLYIYVETTELALREFYNPEKINIAMFGNYLPHLHVHVIARFKEDKYFPESMWGVKQRESSLNLPDFKMFEKKLVEMLKLL